MRTLEARLTSPIGFAVVILALMTVWMVALSSVTEANGNRGSVKLHAADGQEIAEDDRRNQPKACDFTIHWFGGNPHESATWWFESMDTGATTPEQTYESDENGNASAEAPRLEDGHWKLYWTSSEGHTKHKVVKVDCPDEPQPPGQG